MSGHVQIVVAIVFEKLAKDAIFEPTDFSSGECGGLFRAQAVVAAATGGEDLLAQVAENHLAAAAWRADVGKQCVEALAISDAATFVLLGLLVERALRPGRRMADAEESRLLPRRQSLRP